MYVQLIQCIVTLMLVRKDVLMNTVDELIQCIVTLMSVHKDVLMNTVYSIYMVYYITCVEG